MADRPATFRAVVESGYILVIQTAPEPDGVGLVVWDGGDAFTVWFSFDGCTWERVGRYRYPADDWRDAQEWAAHRLVMLAAAYPA